MEKDERFIGKDMMWGMGPYGVAPNGIGYGLGYSMGYPGGPWPYFGMGLEPNLWAENEIMNMPNNTMRDHMPGMPGMQSMPGMSGMQSMPGMQSMDGMMQMNSIDMMYPKCHKLMHEVIYKECNMYAKGYNGIMPNKISKEHFCGMLERCTLQIMNNENVLISKLTEDDMCHRLDECDELETRGNLGRFGNLLVSSLLGILLVQELRRRGCRHCY